MLRLTKAQLTALRQTAKGRGWYSRRNVLLRLVDMGLIERVRPETCPTCGKNQGPENWKLTRHGEAVLTASNAATAGESDGLLETRLTDGLRRGRVNP